MRSWRRPETCGRSRAASLGDDTFLTFLKSYQKSFRWKFGSTKTVAGLLEFLTKKDYRSFFEVNYWGTGIPD